MASWLRNSVTFFVLMVVFVSASPAQCNYIYKEYRLQSMPFILNTIVATDSGYLVAGTVRDSALGGVRFGSRVLRLNECGNIVDQSPLIRDTSDNESSIVPRSINIVTPNKIIFTEMPLPDQKHINLIAMDSGLQVTKTVLISYDTGCYAPPPFMYNSACKYFNNEILVQNFYYCWGNRSLLQLVKFDSSINLIWERRFFKPNFNYYPSHLLHVADGYVLAGGLLNDEDSHSSKYTSSNYLIKTDTSGSPVWQYNTPLDSAYDRYGDILVTQDSGYVLVSSWKGTDFLAPANPNGYGDWRGISTVTKLDQYGTVKWQTRLDNYYGTISGSTRYLWANGLFNYNFKLKELSDGSILMAGYMTDSLSTDSIGITTYSGGTGIMKLSKDGDIMWEKHLNLMDADSNAIILRRTIKDFCISKDEDIITMVGNTNYANYPYEKGWLFQMDSCGRTELNGDCAPRTGIDNPTVESGEEFKVYPNPAQSQITITSPSHKTGEVWIDVYSIDGRVVLKRRKLNLPTHQIDVQGWPAGVYLYRIESLDKEIRQTGRWIKM